MKNLPTTSYATYEIFTTPSGSMQRLCLLTLSRLFVFKPLGSKASSISIAVKLQGSKRTLRSNEMKLPSNGLIDTELLLHYTLRYTHFYKHDGNKLHIMIQRRKKYTTRLFLRYKTIADGVINLSEIIQFPVKLELDLLSAKKIYKGINNICARVLVRYLCSLPVDYEERTKTACDNVQAGNDDYKIVRNNDGSDSEPVIEVHRDRKTSGRPNAIKRNFKQLFFDFLKRFRINEKLHGHDKNRNTKSAGSDMDATKMDLCDPDPEMDSSSISSPPRPRLKRFFSSSSQSFLQDSVSLSGSVNRNRSNDISRLDNDTLGNVKGKARKIKRRKFKSKLLDGKRRLCSLTLSRLIIFRSLGSEVSSISIAVKMQGSKRTLRSNEMTLPVNGLLDTELQLHFSLQYPHFLKRDGNKLHIMLQRRKRYKNRTILGYKTLAEGVVNMSQILQKPVDLELDLFSDIKECKGSNNFCARISVNSLNSQPVDYEGPTKTTHHNARIGDYSDDEEEFSSNDDGSDSEPMIEDHRERKTSLPPNARQRNFKQKFIALLKRFRVNEDLHGLDPDRETKLAGGDMDAAEIADLFEEFDLSDSGPEMDTSSISSTPKPSLRPFFSSSSRSLLQDSANSLESVSLNRRSCETSRVTKHKLGRVIGNGRDLRRCEAKTNLLGRKFRGRKSVMFINKPYNPRRRFFI